MSSEVTCTHCGEPCNGSAIIVDKHVFCCNGCKTVYELLQEANLNDYYTYEKAPGLKPESFRNEQYKFLDLPEVADEYIRFSDGDLKRVSLFLPAIHCSSCIWLLENLHKLSEGVISSEVNFLKKTATISYDGSVITLSQLASMLHSIGYPPKFGKNSHQARKRLTSTFYLQLGVAGFCFGNIMLLTFPEYLNFQKDAVQEFRLFFSYLILGLSVPVILFSAKDYLVSAYKILRAGQINLDVPIALGILVLYGSSLHEIISGNGPGYMDSFAGFIFFLLIGKWFQNYTYDALSFDRDYKSYFPVAVTRKSGNTEDLVPIAQLNTGDHILIHSEEVLPADAELMSAEAHIDYSFVTGESQAKKVHQGEKIFAGGKQVGENILLKVLKPVNQSYLTSLWNQKAFNKEDTSSIEMLTGNLSRYFIAGVITIAVLSGITWYMIDPTQVAKIVVSVLIVACPCALALAAPFTFGHAQRISGKHNLYLKSPDVIERFKDATDFVFDKTGTITETHLNDMAFEGGRLSEEDIMAISALTGNSTHPLSMAITQQLHTGSSNAAITSFFEEKGKGIGGTIYANTWKIGSASFVEVDDENPEETRVYVQKNNKTLGYFRFYNHYREGLAPLMKQLQELGKVHILSGDNASEQPRLRALLGEDVEMQFNKTPQEKLNYIEQLQKEGKTVMMLGDGLNDAGALKQSNIGISVVDDIYSFSPACDGILKASELKDLKKFVQLSVKSGTILRSSLIISLLYNITGLTFAIGGYLTPLVAAILMPLSSVTIVAYTSGFSFLSEHQIFKAQNHKTRNK